MSGGDDDWDNARAKSALVDHVRRLSCATKVMAQAVETDDDGLFLTAMFDIHNTTSATSDYGRSVALFVTNFSMARLLELRNDYDAQAARYREAMSHLGFELEAAGGDDPTP